MGVSHRVLKAFRTDWATLAYGFGAVNETVRIFKPREEHADINAPRLAVPLCRPFVHSANGSGTSDTCKE